jgi:hypothetical protein
VASFRRVGIGDVGGDSDHEPQSIDPLLARASCAVRKVTQ